MPLPIRDGNQSLTTLSTILVSNSHIPAHTVISFGTQGITDIATAVSGVELGPNTLNALENITVTLGQVTITGGLTDAQLRASAVTVGGGVYLADAQSVIGSSIPPEVIQIGGKNIADSKLYPISVDSNGVQSISGAVTASISGTPSVTFGTAVVTGSTSILNFPATQTVTFSQASVTFGTSVVTGSVSVLNIPTTQTVTFTQASVTFSQPTITGSVSVLNFPASQSVTFTTATVTFGTAVITGSTSVLNFPATQTVTFSEAPVTFGLISGTVTANPTGTQTIAGSVTIGAGTAQIGSVTASISNSVTIASLPAISGTVTATGFDPSNGISKTIPVIRCDDGIATNQDAVPVAIAIESGSVNTANPIPISGTISGTRTAATTGNEGGLLAYGYHFGDGEANAIPFTYNGDGNLSVEVGGNVKIGNSVTIASGTVTANNVIFNDVSGFQSAVQAISDIELNAIRSAIWIADSSGSNGSATEGQILSQNYPMPISGTVTIGSLPALVAGTAQIGSVTASVTNPVTVGAIVGPIGGSVFKGSPTTESIRSLPYFSQNGSANYNELSTSNPFPIAGTVTIANIQGTTVTTSNFTSTTPSTVLVGFAANREVLTIFNEGAGNLHICAGATCTTIAYQVRLSAGDYYEVPLNQTSLTHSAVFATAGTARVTQVS